MTDSLRGSDGTDGGPPRDAENMARGRLQFLMPTLFLGGAGLLIVVSIFLPYARIRLAVPSSGRPLEIGVYLDHLGGDVAAVQEVAPHLLDEPRPSREVLERSLSLAAIVAIVLLGAAAIYVHNRWAALLCLPALVFPLVFLGDFRGWLAGLEPAAKAVDGSLSLESGLAFGWVVASIASLFVLVGLLFHWKAYRGVVRR